MRAIKFRAWNGYEMIMPREKSYYQHYMSFCGSVVQKSSEVMDCFGGGDKWRVVDDLKLMQFTGLLDKNGVEIYEGDIVNVVFDDGVSDAMEVRYKAPTFILGGHGVWAFQSIDVTLEVIGNIHETPELLK